MNLAEIIDDLQEYCYEEKTSFEGSKEMIDDYQIEFLDGYIGIVVNQYIGKNKFEVYLHIKTIDKIACPLLYKTFYEEEEAKKYHEELKKFINDNNEKNIVNRCKIRE